MVIKYVRIRLEAWRVCPCQERQKQRASLLRWWGRADSHGFRPMESQALMVWSLIMSLWSGENPLGRFVSDVRILFGSLKRPWIFQFLITTKYCITILYWISVFAFWACHLKACKPLHCTEGSTRWGRWRRLSREIPWASSEGWQSPASSMPACGSTAQKAWPMLAAVGRGWPLFRWTSEPEPECTECFPVGAPARHVSVSRYTDQVDVYHTGLQS